MDSPEEMIRKVNDVHTKLGVFFANYLIEIEARQMALEFAVVELGKLETAEFAQVLADQQKAMRTDAELRFLQRLKNDPTLAWLTAEFRPDTVQ